jgi:hypothetical protein
MRSIGRRRNVRRLPSESKRNHVFLFHGNLHFHSNAHIFHIDAIRFIYEELQLSPWNISGDFIDIHKRSLGGAMMKLTGFGDPSGLGEAYNFLREADSRLSKSISTPNSDGALQQQIKKITGTQNDLRKLTMKQMAR